MLHVSDGRSRGCAGLSLDGCMRHIPSDLLGAERVSCPLPPDLLCRCFRGACGLEYSPGQRLEGRPDTRLLRLESVAGWLQRAPGGQSDPQH